MGSLGGLMRVGEGGGIAYKLADIEMFCCGEDCQDSASTVFTWRSSVGLVPQSYVLDTLHPRWGGHSNGTVDLAC
jgi:hypothetical protein